MTGPTRSRPDRCPGVLRPWPAPDGALVRVRLVGGRLPAPALRALSALAVRLGDGDLHLTSRANLQLRGLPDSPDVVTAVEDAGLLPSRTHDLVRNVLVSPLTGRAGSGGRTDLRPVAARLDALLCADERLAGLPGKFLFSLDDGRGDLADQTTDLGLVALDADRAQVRVGSHGWGDVVPLAEAPEALLALAHRFLDVRGTGADAAWHVDELASPVAAATPRHPRTQVHAPPLPHDAEHVAAPDGVVDPGLAVHLAERAEARGGDLTITPWRGVLLPEATR